MVGLTFNTMTTQVNNYAFADEPLQLQNLGFSEIIFGTPKAEDLWGDIEMKTFKKELVQKPVMIDTPLGVF